MSNTYKHKEEGKANNGIIEYNKVSNGTQRLWDRKNFEVGRRRKQRNKLKAKIHLKAFTN